MSEELLKVENLSIGFKQDRHSKDITDVVKNISFSINKGEKVAIVGESGSGKSTTAHSIINLLPGTGKITAGSIKFQGKELVNAKKEEIYGLRGKHIGLVPQDPMQNLNPVYKIGTQIKEALRANTDKKLDKKELEKLSLQRLEEAGLKRPEKRVHSYPHEFSGGMLQRTLIAIGISSHPELLIADEPTSALDVTVQKKILDHLDHLTAELGITILFITHDLGLAAERCEKLIVMQNGIIVEAGDSKEILNNPRHEYSKKLIAAAPSVNVESKRMKPHLNVSKNILEVKNLNKVFTIKSRGKKSDFHAVKDVSFELKKGTTTAIVGESGSGKTTVANMVLHLLKPESGEILYQSEPKTHPDKMENIWNFNKKDAFAFRRHVQPIFQNPYTSLDPLYSIKRILEEPLHIHKFEGDKEKKIYELLDMVKLPRNFLNRYPNTLSGGQRQRVAIARALCLNPRLVVCDEAVSALDVIIQDQVLQILYDLQKELGISYLFITHDLAVVRQIADDICVMNRGEIVEKNDVESIFQNPQDEYTKKLLNAIPGMHLKF